MTPDAHDALACMFLILICECDNHCTAAIMRISWDPQDLLAMVAVDISRVFDCFDLMSM